MGEAKRGRERERARKREERLDWETEGKGWRGRGEVAPHLKHTRSSESLVVSKRQHRIKFDVATSNQIRSNQIRRDHALQCIMRAMPHLSPKPESRGFGPGDSDTRA